MLTVGHDELSGCLAISGVNFCYLGQFGQFGSFLGQSWKFGPSFATTKNGHSSKCEQSRVMRWVMLPTTNLLPPGLLASPPPIPQNWPTITTICRVDMETPAFCLWLISALGRLAHWQKLAFLWGERVAKSTTRGFTNAHSRGPHPPPPHNFRCTYKMYWFEIEVTYFIKYIMDSQNLFFTKGKPDLDTPMNSLNSLSSIDKTAWTWCPDGQLELYRQLIGIPEGQLELVDNTTWTYCP